MNFNKIIFLVIATVSIQLNCSQVKDPIVERKINAENVTPIVLSDYTGKRLEGIKELRNKFSDGLYAIILAYLSSSKHKIVAREIEGVVEIIPLTKTTFLTRAMNDEVYYYDLKSVIGSQNEAIGYFNHCASLQDGQFVGYQAALKELTLFDVRDEFIKDGSEWYVGPIEGLAVSPNSQELIVSRGSTIILYDIKSKKELNRFNHGAQVSRIEFLTENVFVSMNQGNSEMKIWDKRKKESLRTFTFKDWFPPRSGARCITFLDNGLFLIYVNTKIENNVILGSIDQEKPLAKFSTNNTFLIASLGGNYFICSHFDDTMTVCRIDRDQNPVKLVILKTFKTPQTVNLLARFNEDQTLAMDVHNSINVWDVDPAAIEQEEVYKLIKAQEKAAAAQRKQQEEKKKNEEPKPACAYYPDLSKEPKVDKDYTGFIKEAEECAKQYPALSKVYLVLCSNNLFVDVWSQVSNKYFLLRALIDQLKRDNVFTYADIKEESKQLLAEVRKLIYYHGQEIRAELNKMEPRLNLDGAWFYETLFADWKEKHWNKAATSSERLDRDLAVIKLSHAICYSEINKEDALYAIPLIQEFLFQAWKDDKISGSAYKFQDENLIKLKQRLEAQK